MSEHDREGQPNEHDDPEQDDLSHRDPEASGGDAEAAASVEEREDVATDDDDMFEDPEDS